MNIDADTIAAVATPPGRGGVGIVRISGAQTRAVAQKLIRLLPPPRVARFGPILDADGELLDQGLALFFPRPNSYTGEDVLELHAHGGPVLLDVILRCVLSVQGTRMARPGEFTERAFLNGKLDLLQAQAVADLIDSASAAAVRGAARSLHGDFSNAVRAWREQLIQLRVFVEGAIDFAEEEIDFLQEGEVERRLRQLSDSLHALLGQAKQGALLRDGMRVVIIGQPNVGKSSLINRLAGEELAIVSEIPGTTRDVIQQQILIHGMPVHVVDTAGMREARDAIEREGIRRAEAQMQQADRILLVVDAQNGDTPADNALLRRLRSSIPVTVVYNKIDLAAIPVANDALSEPPRYYLSAKNGVGIDALREHLAQCMGLQSHAGEGVFSARRRHLHALHLIENLLNQSISTFTARRGGELLAEDLRGIQQRLGDITGEFTSDDLLGEIFSQFCIGK